MRFNGSGIAAVVGPNGCGKSNLSDAISWVLGEQSAKSLRGSRMEDVIFAGTRERKPLGMAQVTMTLVDPDATDDLLIQSLENGNGNGDGHHPKNGEDVKNVHEKASKPREIVITRRLFRSGESEYLIDGRLARLRDIQELFMGTGLGPESYAIIEQGRIGQILSSRPQDRRAVIEEAAGISKFKAKRRLAEAKLEGAKQNLTRVFDILDEVGRQVNSLKRQASKARRYEELKAEMLGYLRRSLAGRFRMLEREASKCAIDLNFATSELNNLNARVSEKERAQAALQEQCYRLEELLTEQRRQLAEHQLEAERTRGRLENQAQQIGAIAERLAAGKAEALDLEGRLEKLAADIAAHAQAVEELDRQAEAARARLTAKNEEREKLHADLRGREQTVETARQQVLRLLGEASTLRNQLAQIDEYLASMERDKARLRKEEESSAAEQERLGAVKEQLSERLAARQMELESITEKRRQAESELNARKSAAAEARRQLEQLRSEASRLKARRDSLEEILSHRAYTTDSVKRLFTAIERGQAPELRPVGVLADFVEVDAAYEKAAEEFLHDELEYVVVHDWPQAEQGIDLMHSDLDGRATFLVHPRPEDPYGMPPAADPAIGPETGIVGRLSDVLRMTNGLTRAPAELLPRLARCFLAEDRLTAQRLALQYPDAYFLLADGVCYHGHAVSGGKKTGSGPLALKRELRELITLTAGRQQQVEATAAHLESLEQEIQNWSDELERLRQAQQGQEKEALALDHEMRKLGEELSRANSRLSVARLDLERLGRETERSNEQRDRNQLLIEEREGARCAQEEVIEEARGELTSLQSAVARATEEHSVLRVEMASIDERRRSEAAAQARLEAQAREHAARRDEIIREMDRLGVERNRLIQDNMELEAKAGVLSEQIRSLEGQVAQSAGGEQAMRGQLAGMEEELRQLRSMVQEAHERRSKVELELVRLQAELKYLDETSRKELNLGSAELAAQDENVAQDTELGETQAKYEDLRLRIEALGPVNPQALEEFQEAQQRYDFLNAQRQDLLDSIRDTEKAISDLDAVSRKRFSEAFEAINANFREMFKVLFGGGVGEMRLTDEANLADSGIEMVASPPGKRLQNVLLLSGGEKSLTAMALLMAIFKYQPSPFCILDEVDAPLDEANIQRLMKLLREMAEETQFVMITHAKRTMESSQTMYGVTMQEPGVSRLVSVRFQAAPPLPPPEPKSLAAAAN